MQDIWLRYAIICYIVYVSLVTTITLKTHQIEDVWILLLTAVFYVGDEEIVCRNVRAPYRRYWRYTDVLQ